MHHSNVLVRSTGRFIHLILKTYLIRKGRKALVTWGVVAPCLDLKCQNFLFSGKFWLPMTKLARLQPIRTAACALRASEAPLSQRKRVCRASHDESCWCICITSAFKCISFLISKGPSSKKLIVWVKRHFNLNIALESQVVFDLNIVLSIAGIAIMTHTTLMNVFA